MYNNVYLVIIFQLLIISEAKELTADEKVKQFGGKSTQIDKLIIKNQIGYHFKKVVRDVSQELFVSRRVNVSSLMGGIQALEITHEKLSVFCHKIKNAKPDKELRKSRQEGFIRISNPPFANFIEAEARCKAKGMQLPEVYTEEQFNDLSAFLNQSHTEYCFAGIKYDEISGMQRYISTGFHVWQSNITAVYINQDQEPTSFSKLATTRQIRFIYASNNKLRASYDSPKQIEETSMVRSTQHQIGSHILSQKVLPIICEEKWNGLTLPINQPYREGVSDSLPGLTANNMRSRRSLATSRQNLILMKDDVGIKGLCLSIADQAKELHDDLLSKLTKLFMLVDISIHLDETKRVKRVPFLAKFFFKTGFKMIWGLFGFIDKLRTKRKIKHLEADNETNKKEINKLTKEVISQSISMKQLYAMHNELISTVNKMNERLIKVEQELESIGNVVETLVMLNIIQNHISRAEHSLNSGYDILKDIIHCSKMGQTSPLVLPNEQLIDVQSQINTFSTSIVDNDFTNMQSIVVSDPDDPHLLMVIVNMAAQSRQEVELIKLVPIPYYKDDQTFQPIVDYETIVLNQFDQTYSVLNEIEEAECLVHRCYVSDVERKVMDNSCGIPQFYDKLMDKCVSEKLKTNGIFLKPMLPDGILFSLKQELQTQLFCNNNRDIRTPQKLFGVGILQVPRGCTLSLTDEHGRLTKIKGQPVIRMLDVETLSLDVQGPMGSMQPYKEGNGSRINSKYDEFLDGYMQAVVKQAANTDSKISNHSTL